MSGRGREGRIIQVIKYVVGRETALTWTGLI